MPDLIPVFAFPSTITFYASNQLTHKQVITIHNPYEFAVQFRVLCSSKERRKYSIVDPEGVINSNCCVDLVIRHNFVTPQNIGQRDKFRIKLYQFSSNQIVGKKDIVAELLENEPVLTQSTTNEMTQQSSATNSAQFQFQRRTGVRSVSINTGVVVLAVICAVTLLLPSQGEPSSLISDYLKPTVTIKLVASYVLGLLTMVILRPA